jgi:hypothetical protein
MFGFSYDDYPDCYGSDEEEAYEALSWSQRLDMLEEMCELLGMDIEELLVSTVSITVKMASEGRK